MHFIEAKKQTSPKSELVSSHMELSPKLLSTSECQSHYKSCTLFSINASCLHIQVGGGAVTSTCTNHSYASCVLHVRAMHVYTAPIVKTDASAVSCILLWCGMGVGLGLWSICHCFKTFDTYNDHSLPAGTHGHYTA